jgi:hypothetical protein
LAGAVLTPAAVLLGVTVAVAVAFGLSSTTVAGHFALVTVAVAVLGGFAAVLTAVPLDDESVLATAYPRFVAAIAPLGLAQVAVVSVAAWDVVADSLAGLVVDSPEPLLAVGRLLLAPRGSLALLSALAYVVLLLALTRRLVASLPLAALFPTRQRATIRSRIDRATARLERVTAGAVVLTAVIGVGALAAGVARPAALAAALPRPFAGLAVWLLTTVWLRVAVVVCLGVLAAVLVGERLRRRFRRSSETDILRTALPAIGAIATALAAAVAVHVALSPAWVLARLPFGFRPAAAEVLAAGGLVSAVFVATLAAVVAACVAFVLCSLLVASPLAPDRGLGPALASAAAFGLAVVLVVFDGPLVLALLGAALAVVAWDAGEFAIGLREELPTDAATSRGELVHAGASLAVGAVAVCGALVVDVLVGSGLLTPAVSDTALTAGAVTIAFATVVVLLSALRG